MAGRFGSQTEATPYGDHHVQSHANRSDHQIVVHISFNARYWRTIFARNLVHATQITTWIHSCILTISVDTGDSNSRIFDRWLHQCFLQVLPNVFTEFSAIFCFNSTSFTPNFSRTVCGSAPIRIATRPTFSKSSSSMSCGSAPSSIRG